MKLYTWKNPGDRNRYQINYILVKQRFRNSIGDVKTLPGANIDSDHNLLVAQVQSTIKAIKKNWEEERKMEFGKNQEQRKSCERMMKQKFSQIDGITGSVEDNWGKVKETVGYPK